MEDFLDFFGIFFDILWMYSPAAVVVIALVFSLALFSVATAIVHEVMFQVSRWRYHRGRN